MPISHNLSNLPLRPSSLTLLEQRGFISTAEIDSSKRSGGVANLAAELRITLAEAASIIREVDSAIQSVTGSDGDHNGNNSTALSILKRAKTTERNIVTFSKAIDNLLGGGISKSEVTEVVGLPGTGKTQLAMQLCVDARLPTSFGGVAGESVYIDTEGSFSPERCYTMAKALVDHVQRSIQRRRFNSPQVSIPDIPPWFHANNILDGIHVYRVHDEAAQTATIHSLPTFLKQRTEHGTPVRLVIIDSIAFHYRCAPPGSDFMARTRSLTNTAAFLSDLAATFDLAVVVINQMTTKVGENEARVVPALGESWAHATTTRILMSRTDHPSIRQCTLVKSPDKAAGTAMYDVQEAGIRDVPNSSDNAKRIGDEASDNDTVKRQRQLV